MRVVFASHSVAPVNLGGAERSLIRLVEEWQAKRPDLDFEFFTKAPEGTFIRELKKRSWAFRAFRFRGWALPSPQPAPVSETTFFATADYAAVSRMIAILEQDPPDLVVTNTLVAPWAAFAAKSLGIPHAWFVREYGDLDHGLNFQIGRASTLADIGLMSEAVFTNSFALRDHLSPFMPGHDIGVAYPQLDEAELRERAAAPLPLDPFPQADSGLKITIVGRLEPGKGQLRVIEALGRLAADGISASLCLVGSWKDPGYDDVLRSRARALGVGDRLTIVGEQANPFPFVAAADVCVTPSTLEAFGRTTLEYMTLGKAVVASDSGGSAELVAPGESGFLFDLSDPASLAEHLAAYAADPRLAADHGAAAARRALDLTSRQSNAAVIERLESLVGGPAYRLPEMARYWFSLPGAYSSLGGMTARSAAGILVSRVRTRSGLVGRVLKRPSVVLKKLTRR